MKFKILNSSLIDLNTDSICIPYYKNNNKNTDLNSVNNLIDNLIDSLDAKKQISSDLGAITNTVSYTHLRAHET